MSIATVVTRGYGTFGNVNFVTVRGYGDYGEEEGRTYGLLYFWAGRRMNRMIRKHYPPGRQQHY